MTRHTNLAKACRFIALWCAGFTSVLAEDVVKEVKEVKEEDRFKSPVYDYTYDEKEATKYAYLVAALYCSQHDITNLRCGIPCQHIRSLLPPETERPLSKSVRVVFDTDTETRAVLFRFADDTCALSFRGTANEINWEEDALSFAQISMKWCSYKNESCKLGYGALHMFEAVEPGIREGLDDLGCTNTTPLVVSGHSLGGSLAELAMFNLSFDYNVTAGYTYGKPRQGDLIFAKAFYTRLGATPLNRVTRYDDPVIFLPLDRMPRYHLGHEVYYTPSGYRTCQPPSLDDPVNKLGINNSCSGQADEKHVLVLTSSCSQPFFSKFCGHYQYLSSETKVPLSGEACSSALLLA